MTTRRHVALTVLLALVAPLLTAMPAQAAAPARPAFAVTASATSATFTWPAVRGAESYVVCLRRTAGQKDCTVRTKRLTSRSVTLTGLSGRSGWDYYASLTAHGRDGYTVSDRRPFELNVTPARPTGVRTSTTYDTVEVRWDAAARATSYDVCLRTRSATSTCYRTSPRSTARTARFTGLVPTGGADYLAVVRAHRGSATASSGAVRADLKVGAVGTVTLSTTTTTLPVRWPAARNAEGYEVVLATSSDLRSGRTTRVVQGNRSVTTTFTGLTPGRRYHLRVTGLNSPVRGRSSAVVTRVLPTAAVPVRVVTFNLCGQDKCRTGSTAKTVKPWSQRKALAGKAVRDAWGEVVATQESGDKDTNFISVLPGFRRAAYLRARSLFYKTELFELKRSGGLTVDSRRKRYAVWAELVDKRTRTPFIVVDAHLEPYKGRSKDDVRYTQTRTLLKQVAALNPQKLPVVYAGDFNSNGSNADQKRYPGGYDGPRKAFEASGYVNTLRLAPGDDAKVVRPDYNSANQGIVKALRHGDHIDAVYATRAVRVIHWEIRASLASASTYRVPLASDHNPLKTILLIPGQREKP